MNIEIWHYAREGFMGRTSSKVKGRYNKKAYHTISIRLPKGWRDQVKEAAEAVGESFAGYVRSAVETRMNTEGRSIRKELLDAMQKEY